MKLSLDSYLLLLLYAPLAYSFYKLATWMGCESISKIDEVAFLLDESGVPTNATCFSTNHLEYLTFYSYPPIDESPIVFASLAILVVVLGGLVFAPTVKLVTSFGQ